VQLSSPSTPSLLPQPYSLVCSLHAPQFNTRTIIVPVFDFV
jgi:hypothetical protein